MAYTILADATMVVHFLWVVFVVFGILLALMKSRLAWLHLGGICLALLLNLLGWYCPLTYLENYLYLKGGSSVYEGSFIVHYLAPLLYPDLPEVTVRTGGIVFVCVNLLVYGVLFKKRTLPRPRGLTKPKTGSI